MAPLCDTTRRGFLAGAAIWAGTLHAAGVPARLVSLEYGFAETLLAMGVTPTALAETDEWSSWVVDPALPESVTSLGSTLEANIKLLHALKPDLILTTPYLAPIRPMLERIARTETFGIYTPDAGTPYQLSAAAARRLSGLLAQEPQAEAIITGAAALMETTWATLAPYARTPLFVVNFMDTRHVRVYGAKSMFDDVMTLCSLTNAWCGNTNYRGFATVGIEQLARAPHARLVYLEPIATDVAADASTGRYPVRRIIMMAVNDGSRRLSSEPMLIGMATGHSKPFALWKVIISIASRPASSRASSQGLGPRGPLAQSVSMSCANCFIQRVREAARSISRSRLQQPTLPDQSPWRRE